MPGGSWPPGNPGSPPVVDEDAALADYIEASMSRGDVDAAPYLDRVRGSIHGVRITNSNDAGFQADLACCLEIDRFDFAMPVTHEEGLLVLRADRQDPLHRYIMSVSITTETRGHTGGLIIYSLRQDDRIYSAGKPASKSSLFSKG